MRGADSQGLAPLVPLLTELNDLKRVRTADSGGSLAGGLFRRSWAALLDGEDPDLVALRETASALASARLGGISAPKLSRGGLSEADVREVIGRGFDAVSAPLSEGFAKELRRHLTDGVPPEPGGHPDFVETLDRQPRAGATRPGRPRLILEPPESHAEHCAVVAVYGVLLSPGFGADPSGPFLAGLAHHLHNAYLPDAGFAGEALLGGHLEAVIERFTEEALAQLPEKLVRRVRASLRLVGNVESPASKAFNAADVIDRVLQMRHHARAAAFTLDQALDEMELVHEGPLKSFHDETLREASLLGRTVARSPRKQPPSLRDPSWPDGALRSPETGLPLGFDTPHSVTDGTTRWPVADGIPFLRTGREDLRGKALVALDAGDERAALVELLRDQDDWAPDPPPDRENVEAILDRNPNLRRAMELLGFGPVADYFTYRLSDPTYLAGLALISTHWNAPKTSFELACGIGHYSRELSRRGVETAAGDVVFAKLWLARRYVTPETRLVCFDAAGPFPLSDGAADLALCNDALYFLPEKRHVAGELLRVAGEGTVIVGHAHNAAVENHSSGAPLTVEGYAELFPEPLLYDDADATEAFFSGEALEPREANKLFGSEAICLVTGGDDSGPVSGSAPDLTLPPPGTPLVTNPLYEFGNGDPVSLRLRWPSERYEAEYAPRFGYLPEKMSVARDVLDRAVAGDVDEEVERLARRRVLLDLPGEC